MDEFRVISRARVFIREINSTAIPAPIQAYVDNINGKLTRDKSMGPDEAGSSFESSGRYFITVNGNDRTERQNFTVCHEIAHIVLGLPSEHGSGPWWSYAKRSPNEIACDIFAAELLLPHHVFKPLVEQTDFGFAAIGQLARRFEASLSATGSRFAAMVDVPCACVLAEQGKIRYPARSTALREARGWIQPGSRLPAESLAEKLRADEPYTGPIETAADLWFDNWARGGAVLEDARYYRDWDQTLSLIWFEDEEIPPPPRTVREEEEEMGLRELDGILPWPGNKRRRP
jgi:Zn-dependent peptidase ImmA (M78 family)